MSLCRHYVRELRRSVLISTPDLSREAVGSHRSSALLDDSIPGPSNRRDGSLEDRTNDQRLSAFLRADSLNFDQFIEQGNKEDTQRGRPSGSLPRGSNDPSSSAFLSTPDPMPDQSSPSHTIARADIRSSAEKILYTYLLADSEREIVLPEPILRAIANAIEVDGRDDPEVFDEAKDYVFQAMERDAFPGFLRNKALGNLIPASSMVRLIVGLLGMFAGFWAGFCMIFLDLEPKINRLWVCLHSRWLFAVFGNLGANHMFSSFSHSPSASTCSWHTNTLLTRSWHSLVSVSTSSANLCESRSRM